jgi:hypothetical protein
MAEEFFILPTGINKDSAIRNAGTRLHDAADIASKTTGENNGMEASFLGNLHLYIAYICSRE